MKIRIYSAEYPTPLPLPHFLALLHKLPSAIRQKVEKFNRWQDAYGSLFGKILLVRALQDAGLSGDLNELLYTQYGKPYLPKAPDFNISHSGNRVVCIMYDGGRVAIDLEEIRDLHIDDLKPQFSDSEWQAIQHSAEPLHAFYHFWTAKESILKADGRGLNLSLADLNIDSSQEVLVDGCLWNIRKIHSFANYACHIAYEGKNIDWEVIQCPIYN
jgi:4'-phosphopantetheinyl transferase